MISPTDLKSVTPDANEKTRFVIVDAIGVTESDLVDTTPLEKNPSVSFSKILEQVAFGDRSSDVMSTLARRLARLHYQLTDEERSKLKDAAGGVAVEEIAASILRALDPDEEIAEARRVTGESEPPEEAIAQAAVALLNDAAQPIANPVLRNLLVDIKRSHEQTIEVVLPVTMHEDGFPTDRISEAEQSILIGELQTR